MGKKEAKLALGGERVGDKGFFVAPTIFVGVKRDMRIGAGGGLRAGPRDHGGQRLRRGDRHRQRRQVWPHVVDLHRDVNRVFQYLERIETGITHVNSGTVGGEAQLPFGGMKATGVGAREMGRTAIEFYSEWKTVYVDYTGAKRTTNIY